MKYDTFELFVMVLLENNIELDRDTFIRFLNAKGFVKETGELLLFLLNNDIKNKNTYFNWMINLSDERSAMILLKKILYNDKLKNNNHYIDIIMSQDEQETREILYRALQLEIFVENKYLFDYLLSLKELYKIRLINYLELKKDISKREIELLVENSPTNFKNIMKELEFNLLLETKSSLEKVANLCIDNPDINNLKELKLCQEKFHKINSRLVLYNEFNDCSEVLVTNNKIMLKNKNT